MITQKKLHLSITQDFVDVYDEASKLVEDDDDYKKLLSDRISKDKRMRDPNRRESIKFRFFISYWLTHNKGRIIQLKLDKLKARKQEQNAQT